MRLGKGGGAVSALLRNQPPFGRVTRQEGIFEHNSGRPLLHAFFDEALCMNIGIPRVVGVGVEGITGRWRVRGISRWVCEGWCICQRRRSCPYQP